MTFNSSSRKLEAAEGKFIAKKDLSEVYGNCIYLGIYDLEANYTEVDEIKKNEILASIEEKMKQEEELRRQELEAEKAEMEPKPIVEDPEAVA